MSEFDSNPLVLKEGRSVALSSSDVISGDLRFFAPSLGEGDLICGGVQLGEPDVLDAGDVDDIDGIDDVIEEDEDELIL